jgi:phosphosulfolactate phosphohydrolase-like enzyme
VEHIETLAEYEFNYSAGETLRFALDDWVGADEIKRLLQDYAGDPNWGDVYARRPLVAAPPPTG